VQPLDIEYLRAVEGTLSEWAGEADEEAYREL
jgi:antitoxin PrlF